MVCVANIVHEDLPLYYVQFLQYYQGPDLIHKVSIYRRSWSTRVCAHEDTRAIIARSLYIYQREL